MLPGGVEVPKDQGQIALGQPGGMVDDHVCRQRFAKCCEAVASRTKSWIGRIIKSCHAKVSIF